MHADVVGLASQAMAVTQIVWMYLASVPVPLTLTSHSVTNPTIAYCDAAFVCGRAEPTLQASDVEDDDTIPIPRRMLRWLRDATSCCGRLRYLSAWSRFVSSKTRDCRTVLTLTSTSLRYASMQSVHAYLVLCSQIIFEISSAYGTVGLSLGYPNSVLSFSAQFSVAAKVIMCFVMLLGRHRGLPTSLDTAVRLVSRNEDEATERKQQDLRERASSLDEWQSADAVAFVVHDSDMQPRLSFSGRRRALSHLPMVPTSRRAASFASRAEIKYAFAPRAATSIPRSGDDFVGERPALARRESELDASRARSAPPVPVAPSPTVSIELAAVPEVTSDDESDREQQPHPHHHQQPQQQQQQQQQRLQQLQQRAVPVAPESEPAAASPLPTVAPDEVSPL